MTTIPRPNAIRPASHRRRRAPTVCLRDLPRATISGHLYDLVTDVLQTILLPVPEPQR